MFVSDLIVVQRLSPLTFGLVLWYSEEPVLSEADLRRHEVAVKLVRKELDVLVVLVDSGLVGGREEREERRRGRKGRRGRRGRKEVYLSFYCTI